MDLTEFDRIVTQLNSIQTPQYFYFFSTKFVKEHPEYFYVDAEKKLRFSYDNTPVYELPDNVTADWDEETDKMYIIPADTQNPIKVVMENEIKCIQ